MRNLLILSFLLTGCGAEHGPYRLILVEKERKFLDLQTGAACEPSGYDIDPKFYKKENREEAELMITYSNCSVREKVILDDKQKVMWGIPMKKPKTETP